MYSPAMREDGIVEVQELLLVTSSCIAQVPSVRVPEMRPASSILNQEREEVVADEHEPPHDAM